MFDISPMGMAIISEEGNFVRVNSALANLLGYELSDLMKLSITKITHPEDVAADLDNKARLLSGETHAVQRRKRYLHRNGHSIWVLLHGSIVRDESTGEVFFVAQIQDLTEQRNTEHELQLKNSDLHGIVNAFPDLYFWLDKQGNYIRFHSNGETLVEPEVFLNRNYREIMPTSVLPLLEDALTRATTDKVVVEVEYALELPDGEHWYEARIQDLPDSATLVAVREITARKSAQEKFRCVVEASPNGMLVVDNSGTILLSNARCGTLLGYSVLDLKQVPLKDLLPAFDFSWLTPDQVDRTVDDSNVSVEANPPSYRCFGQHVNGWPIPVDVRVNHFSFGKSSQWLLTVIDVSEYVEAQRLLSVRAEELARSNHELEQFAYVASHDLREPLRMVRSYCTLLAERYRDKIDDKANMFLDFAVDGAVRMQALIDDLLTYSQIRRDQETVKSTSLKEVVDRALQNLHVSIQESAAEFDIGWLPWMDCNPVQMGQLFQNLISNSIKFRGKSSPRIEIQCQTAGDRFHFTVRDNGIGIEAEYFERVFQVFQRLHTYAEYPGTGMGLAICKRVVELHGGSITIQPNTPSGTIFLISLPKSEQPF